MEESKLIDVYGKAIIDYFMGEKSKIITYSTVGGKDELPVAHLFRSYEKRMNYPLHIYSGHMKKCPN